MTKINRDGSQLNAQERITFFNINLALDSNYIGSGIDYDESTRTFTILESRDETLESVTTIFQEHTRGLRYQPSILSRDAEGNIQFTLKDRNMQIISFNPSKEKLKRTLQDVIEKTLAQTKNSTKAPRPVVVPITRNYHEISIQSRSIGSIIHIRLIPTTLRITVPVVVTPQTALNLLLRLYLSTHRVLQLMHRPGNTEHEQKPDQA